MTTTKTISEQPTPSLSPAMSPTTQGGVYVTRCLQHLPHPTNNAENDTEAVCTTRRLQHPHYPAKTTKTTRRRRIPLRRLYHIPIPWTTPNTARTRSVNDTEVPYHANDPQERHGGDAYPTRCLQHLPFSWTTHNDTEATCTQRVTPPSCGCSVYPTRRLQLLPHPTDVAENDRGGVYPPCRLHHLPISRTNPNTTRRRGVSNVPPPANNPDNDTEATPHPPSVLSHVNHAPRRWWKPHRSLAPLTPPHAILSTIKLNVIN